MKKKPEFIKDAVKLRRNAEKQLATKLQPVDPTYSDDKKLLHELQVHQIELEMLYENLRQAYEQLEKSWACYYDLYNMAPIGYLTLSSTDLIQDVNTTTAMLLGLSREALIQKPLTSFILDTDHELYSLHRKQLVETGKKQGFELHFVKSDGISFWGRLEMNLATSTGSEQTFRVVMIDISHQQASDDYLRQAAAILKSFVRA